MNEQSVQQFWNSHPCGDAIVGGLHGEFRDDYVRFFDAYDRWRYQQERHIPVCLDQIEWRGREVLEIGLGQGAESEQIIRRGGKWSGLDLTAESVSRVCARLDLRSLPHDSVKQGSALRIPWPDSSFDVVFSHGVLHHIPDIRAAQSEINRVLRPGGMLIAMLYARRSLNYQFSIRVVRRAALLGAFALRRTRMIRSSMARAHIDNAERMGLWKYLRLDNFTHYHTDGPLNPYARVYSPADVVEDFPDFELLGSSTHYMHAPPLPVQRLPFARWLGWHLWVTLRARGDRSETDGQQASDAGRAIGDA